VTEQETIRRNDIQGTATSSLDIELTFKLVTIEATICRALQEDAFEFDVSPEPYRVRFDDEKLRRIYRYQRIRPLGLPLNNLSVWRQGASLGWITEPE
jgi:hypothetical protein